MSAALVDQTLRCSKCEHTWREKIIYGVPIAVWSAHVKSLRCPKCGADWHLLCFIDALITLGDEEVQP